MIAVWDRLVRFTHWSVALLVLGNFINDSGSTWHRYAGYAAAALVVLRLSWSVVSTGYARFSRWWPGRKSITPYLRALAAGNAPRYIGINPAGACMAILLWALMITLGVTGWMMGLDAFWGEDWLQVIHETLAWVLLGCVAIHVTSVITVSIKHRENLPKAMLTGKKRSLQRPAGLVPSEPLSKL